MFVWFLKRFGPVAEQVDQAAAGDSRTLLTARTALAAVSAFLVVILLGPAAIRWLRGHCQERIDSASMRLNELHANKNNTPTMGGLLILAALIASTLLWGDLSSTYVRIGLFVTIGFGGLGVIDDWIKLSTSKRGLSARRKFFVQTLVAGVAAFWLFHTQSSVSHGTELLWPFGNSGIALGWFFCCLVNVCHGRVVERCQPDRRTRWSCERMPRLCRDGLRRAHLHRRSRGHGWLP